MNIILLGAPGAGKGTQGEIISEKFNIPIISTGDIIRESLKNATEIGLKAKSFIDKGHLVPDEVVIEIVSQRIKEKDCKNGFILDGFPRTVVQADSLANSDIKLDYVINIEADEDIIYKRMAGRRICEGCNKVYNIYTEKKSKVDGICDVCASTLVQRVDDNENTVKERLKVYKEQTLPLKDYYKEKGMLYEVNGSNPLPTITQDVMKIFEREI